MNGPVISTTVEKHTDELKFNKQPEVILTDETLKDALNEIKIRLSKYEDYRKPQTFKGLYKLVPEYEELLKAAVAAKMLDRQILKKYEIIPLSQKEKEEIERQLAKIAKAECIRNATRDELVQLYRMNFDKDIVTFEDPESRFFFPGLIGLDIGSYYELRESTFYAEVSDKVCVGMCFDVTPGYSLKSLEYRNSFYLTAKDNPEITAEVKTPNNYWINNHSLDSCTVSLDSCTELYKYVYAKCVNMVDFAGSHCAMFSVRFLAPLSSKSLLSFLCAANIVTPEDMLGGSEWRTRFGFFHCKEDMIPITNINNTPTKEEFTNMLNGAKADILDFGTCGECNWIISKAGVLLIYCPDEKDSAVIHIPDVEIKRSSWGDVRASNEDRFPWTQYRARIVKCYFFGHIIPDNPNLQFLFNRYDRLELIDFGNFDTHNIVNMNHMFSDCARIKQINTQNFNTSNVEDMSYMFSDCVKVKQIDIQSFDTSNVKNVRHMFSGCMNLSKITLGKFNTLNVQTMNSMFDCCHYLRTIKTTIKRPDEIFNTKNVKDFGGMFSCCSRLKSLSNLTLDTSSATDMSDMFSDCTDLEPTAKSLSKLYITKETQIDGIFMGASIPYKPPHNAPFGAYGRCEYFYMSEFDFSKIKDEYTRTTLQKMYDERPKEYCGDDGSDGYLDDMVKLYSKPE